MNQSRPKIQRPGAALAILFGTFFFFMCIFSLVSGLIMPRVSDAVISMRLLIFFQALFLFIVPALITAVLATRLPATMLAIDRCPRLAPTLFIIATIIVAIPAMEYIIAWNAGLHLPESMGEIEQALRTMEDSAASATSLIMGSDTIGSLIVSILIVGIMAGLSEELFFRGALQQTLTSTRLNRHAAVWIAALIFSFMHFQFFGFIPRLILGAFFGYILLWGNNLWYCIIAHATNNILATITMWQTTHSEAPGTVINPDTIVQNIDSTIPQIPMIIASVVLTTLALILLKRQLNKNA